MESSSNNNKEKSLIWWQLSLLGIACTIGTGFFLGSSIAITMAGPSVIFSFAFAGIGTFFVYEALAKMTTSHPEKGSFRTYAKNAYGRWGGFASGWMYWLSEMLISGSQLTALSIFSKLWFPEVPLWIFATGYAILALLVIIIGPNSFDRVENLLAILKAAAIVMFIIIASCALFGCIGGKAPENTIPKTIGELFPTGLGGFLPSLIFGFYGFAGIEIVGLLAVRLKKKSEAFKAGKIMLISLAVIYISSLALALTLVSWDEFTTEKSPFVTALKNYSIPYMADIFNGVFIIAGFSTLVAALFAVVRILLTLAEDKDAPAILTKKIKQKYSIYTLGLTSAGMAVSIILSLVMPDRIYEYITTAAGLMLLYNWFFILGSYGRLHKLTKAGKTKRMVGFIIISVAIIGTVFHETSRPGFFVSLIFIGIIGIVTMIMRHFWNRTQFTTYK